MGDYRQAYLQELESVADIDFRYLVGTEYFERSTKTRVDSPLADVTDRNVYLLGRRLLWQRGVVPAGVAADVCVVEFNPRILSNWCILVARRVLRRPSAVWGHAWSRQGPGSRTEALRRRMRRIATNMLLYTYGQRDELAHDRKQNLFVVPNALYSQTQMVPVGGGARDIVFVGRLVESKKPMLLIEAFAVYARSVSDGRLIVVGDGPMADTLKVRVNDLGIADRVTFTGHVAEVEKVREFYADALCAVSPGFVGLSATQALGFGVPLVYGDAEPHAPEAELLNDANSRAFSSDDSESMAVALLKLRDDADRWRAARDSVSAVVREKYSSEAMAKGMADAVRAIGV